MSPTDEPRLEALDRRGRAAARTLLDDLAARGAHRLDTEKALDPTAVLLDRPAPGEGGRPARRRLVAAAVVAVLAAAGAAVVATRDGGRPDVRSGSHLAYLLPGWLPAGFQPVYAADVPDAAEVGFDAETAVYGDPDADDPWSATIAIVHLVADEELLGDQPSGGEAVTVAGHDARLRRAEGYGPGGPRPGWEVEWRVDDGLMIVSGPLTPEAVLAAAEAATTEPAIDPSGLPDGFTELARGPIVDSTLFTSLFEGSVNLSADGPLDGSGVAVTYADPSETNAIRRALVLAHRPGPASAVDLLRLWFADAEATTVRGQHAVIGRGDEPPGSAGEDGVVAVQWAEPEGQLVTVVGFGVAEGVVLQVAEDVRAASADDVAAMREDLAVPAPRQFGEVPEGHVVPASGETPTGQWRLVVNARRRENIGALTVERMSGAIGSTASTTGDRVEPPLDLQADYSDGTVVVWGVLWVDAATVTVEAPGREPVALDIHEVEGWDRRVVADAFPDDHFTGADGPVSVIARDADGREVGRNDTVLDVLDDG